MLLRKISYRIALQFTGFVFLLFMINGAVFLAADIENSRRTAEFRLQHSSSSVMSRIESWPDIRPERLPPRMRDHIRVVNLQGQSVYAGAVFAGSPFSPDEERTELTLQGDEYGVFTAPLVRRGVLVGFVQVAEPERLQFGDLPRRLAIYLLVSVLVSGLTFLVGLFFARRSLKPAEDMMERLEQFTQDASHELKTPLAALRSSLELALKNGKLKEGIVSAREDVKDITILVERLLELARLDQLSLEKLTIDGTALIRDTVERHRALIAEQKLSLVTHIDDAVLTEGDSALLRQLLTNLLSNAIKFTPEGGTITVRLTKKFLSVTDTGVGIPDEAKSRIFDRFFQADNSRSRGGFGLGLALVKRIADLHRWTVEFESTHEAGTTFTVRFTS